VCTKEVEIDNVVNLKADNPHNMYSLQYHNTSAMMMTASSETTEATESRETKTTTTMMRHNVVSTWKVMIIVNYKFIILLFCHTHTHKPRCGPCPPRCGPPWCFCTRTTHKPIMPASAIINTAAPIINAIVSFFASTGSFLFN
jgi:hypothetical protein